MLKSYKYLNILNRYYNFFTKTECKKGQATQPVLFYIYDFKIICRNIFLKGRQNLRRGEPRPWPFRERYRGWRRD